MLQDVLLLLYINKIDKYLLLASIFLSTFCTNQLFFYAFLPFFLPSFQASPPYQLSTPTRRHAGNETSGPETAGVVVRAPILQSRSRLSVGYDRRVCLETRSRFKRRHTYQTIRLDSFALFFEGIMFRYHVHINTHTEKKIVRT